MICRWCGGKIKPTDQTCARCGRELPPLSQCGGFYDLVPGARGKADETNPVSFPVDTPVELPRFQREQETDRRTASSHGYRKTEKKKHLNNAWMAGWLVALLLMVCFSVRSCSLSGELKKANDRANRLQNEVDEWSRKSSAETEESTATETEESTAAETDETTEASEEPTKGIFDSPSADDSRKLGNYKLIPPVDESGIEAEYVEQLECWCLKWPENGGEMLLIRPGLDEKTGALTLELLGGAEAERWEWKWLNSKGEWKTAKKDPSETDFASRCPGEVQTGCQEIKCILTWESESDREYEITFVYEYDDGNKGTTGNGGKTNEP